MADVIAEVRFILQFLQIFQVANLSQLYLAVYLYHKMCFMMLPEILFNVVKVEKQPDFTNISSKK